MEKLIKFYLLLVLVLSASFSMASDVLDLGKLQVEGEVRMPNIDFIQSGRLPEKVLKKIAEEAFLKYEAQTLKKYKIEGVKND